MTTRTGLPAFTGISTYQDPRKRFTFRYPSDWLRDDLAEDREGVIMRPEPDDPDTYFAIWAAPLSVAAVADDLPELRRGFDDGLAELPGSTIEVSSDDALGELVRLNREVTFDGSAGRCKRHVWAIFADTWQLLISYQGSTIEEYDYWLPMGNYCFNSFELAQELWFATDPDIER